MIGAMPLREKNFESPIFPRFSRSPYFAILNKELRKIEIIENPYNNEMSDAGRIVLERLITNHSVDTLISFELGINIQRLANKKELQLILIDNKNRKLQEIMDLLKI